MSFWLSADETIRVLVIFFIENHHDGIKFKSLSDSWLMCYQLYQSDERAIENEITTSNNNQNLKVFKLFSQDDVAN